MAAFTSKASGDWNADGQTTWNEAGHPDGADDTAAITHAVTAAAAVVCGAITLTGAGSLVATAAPNTITSIANSGTGAVTIGATTFAGVLTNTSSGLLTINGDLTGVTNFTVGNCLMNANVTMNGTLVGPATTRLFTQNGYSLSGFTANVASYAGEWQIAAGATISANSASARSIAVGAGGSMTVNGTAGAGVVNITNAGAGTMTVVNAGSFTGSYYTIKTSLSFQAAAGSLISNYGQHGLTINTYFTNSFCDINHLYCPGGIADASVNGDFRLLRNIAIGYNRDGSASAPATGIADGSNLRIINGVINATAQVATITEGHSVVVDNLGHLDTAMLPGTGSDLDLAVVDAGVSKSWDKRGTIERSAVNPRTGTYHVRITPTSSISKVMPLDCSVYVPIASGDDVAVTAYASRSADTSDCAKILLDPEGAWFTPATSTELLTNTATYYALTVSGATARGTGAKGMVRIVLRVDEYTASQYVDFADFAVVVS